MTFNYTFDLRKSKLKTFLKKFLQGGTLHKKVVMVSDDNTMVVGVNHIHVPWHLHGNPKYVIEMELPWYLPKAHATNILFHDMMLLIM